MTILVGDDWAEAHHDVHLMNAAATGMPPNDSRRALTSRRR